MKKEIAKRIQSDQITSDDLLCCIELVRQSGDVIVLKADGEREENAYTVFVTSPSGKFEMIRCDGNNLTEATHRVLREYVSTDEK